MTFSARHIMYSLRLFLITISVLFTYITSARAEPANERKRPLSIVAVIHCDYSPVSFWNKTTGTPSGFFVDIMDSVAARAGLRVSYICRNNWDEVIAAIESGQADLGVLLKSEEREKKLLFSTPIETTYLSFFARSQSNVDPARVPSNHIVGVIKGSMSHELLKDRKGVRLQIYGGYREGLFGLLAGEISLFAGEESIVLKHMRETDLEDRIKKVGKPFVELQRCLVVRTGKIQLLELVNKALKDFVGGPEYQRNYLKWHGSPTSYWTNRRVLAVNGIFLIIAISGLSFWRYVSISKINTELIRTMSERDRAEKQIQRSLREKETLLNEIHHRVKNNLAVVSSLLGLQAQASDDEILSQALEESQQRIKSMALVHERLYQTRDFSCINYKDFINDIVKELESIHHKRNGEIVTNLNIEDLTLDIDSAIPCSLIINELVTNSYKYAFPDFRSGELGISFARKGAVYTLTIKDNGIGLPKGVDCRKPTTLGLQIVNVLCKQLRGTLQMRSDRGTEAVITFESEGNQHGKEKNTNS